MTRCRYLIDITELRIALRHACSSRRIACNDNGGDS